MSQEHQELRQLPLIWPTIRDTATVIGVRYTNHYRLEEIIGNTLRSKNGLHAFGNNSAENEPILMKSGTV